MSEPTLHHVDAICIRCGQKVIWLSRDPHAPAEVRVVCDRCSEPDQPEPRPDTAWGI